MFSVSLQMFAASSLTAIYNDSLLQDMSLMPMIPKFASQLPGAYLWFLSDLDISSRMLLSLCC